MIVALGVDTVGRGLGRCVGCDVRRGEQAFQFVEDTGRWIVVCAWLRNGHADRQCCGDGIRECIDSARVVDSVCATASEDTACRGRGFRVSFRLDRACGLDVNGCGDGAADGVGDGCDCARVVHDVVAGQ